MGQHIEEAYGAPEKDVNQLGVKIQGKATRALEQTAPHSTSRDASVAALPSGSHRTCKGPEVETLPGALASRAGPGLIA